MAHRPLLDIEILMQMAPGDRRSADSASIFSTLELKEAVGAAIDSLSPEDKYIIEQLLVQGNSLRKLGYVLGIPKTSLARRRDKIRKQLMVELAAHPGIQNWIRT
tara:strand:+ start:152 stop:466 length:315 start_codon:yes stop_codon:yes gene_type:complete